MNLPDRIKSKFSIQENECWVWNHNKTHNGYGQVWFEGAQRRAHRVIYELKYGKIGIGKLACHKCDNPSCVNPDHIFIGTHKDNALDRDKKGRKFIYTKLTKDDVIKIREISKDSKISRAKIANIYNVSKSNIHAILEYRSWPNI